MNHLRESVGHNRYSDSQTYTQRMDTFHAQEGFTLQPLHAAYDTIPQNHQAYSKVSASACNTHRGTQVPPIRDMKPQNNPTTSSPCPHTYTQHGTPDEHRSAIRVAAPNPPRRKTFREVCAGQGEPLAKPRNYHIAQHLHVIERYYGEIQNPDLHNHDYGTFEEIEPLDHSKLLEDFKRGYEVGLEWFPTSEKGHAGFWRLAKPCNSQEYTEKEQVDIARTGGGSEAKTRRDFWRFFRFRH